MKVKITNKPNSSSIWYWNHVGDTIDVRKNKTYNSLYDVIGPKEYLNKIKIKYNFTHFCVDVIHTMDLRKDKFNRILASKE